MYFTNNKEGLSVVFHNLVETKNVIYQSHNTLESLLQTIVMLLVCIIHKLDFS